jgi:hypothetical protein
MAFKVGMNDRGVEDGGVMTPWFGEDHRAMSSTEQQDLFTSKVTVLLPP